MERVYRCIAAVFFRKTWAGGATEQDKERGTMSLDHSPEATPGSVTSQHWLGLDRVRAYSVAMLIAYGVLIVIWGLRTKGLTADSLGRPVDFSAFWSASYLAMKGQAASVYDYETLRSDIAAFGAVQGGGKFFLPWSYPPTFLLFLVPLSLLPFAVSYVLFIGSTVAIAGLAAEGVRRGWMSGERELLVVAWLLPLVLSVNSKGYLPQVGSLVTLALLMAILRRAWRGNRLD